MALPHARKIVVGGVSYQWLIKSPYQDRYGLGWTPPALYLTVKTESAKPLQFNCLSRTWTPAHEEAFFDYDTAGSVSAHKVPFGPVQVAAVLQHDFSIGPATLEGWVVKPDVK